MRLQCELRNIAQVPALMTPPSCSTRLHCMQDMHTACTRCTLHAQDANCMHASLLSAGSSEANADFAGRPPTCRSRTSCMGLYLTMASLDTASPGLLMSASWPTVRRCASSCAEACPQAFKTGSLRDLMQREAMQGGNLQRHLRLLWRSRCQGQRSTGACIGPTRKASNLCTTAANGAPGVSWLPMHNRHRHSHHMHQRDRHAHLKAPA
jgi:hypothetical protein